MGLMAAPLIPAAQRQLADVAGQTHVAPMTPEPEPARPLISVPEGGLGWLYSESESFGSEILHPLEQATDSAVGPHGGLVPNRLGRVAPGPTMSPSSTQTVPGVQAQASSIFSAIRRAFGI